MTLEPLELRELRGISPSPALSRVVDLVEAADKADVVHDVTKDDLYYLSGQAWPAHDPRTYGPACANCGNKLVYRYGGDTDLPVQFAIMDGTYTARVRAGQTFTAYVDVSVRQTAKHPELNTGQVICNECQEIYPNAGAAGL